MQVFRPKFALFGLGLMALAGCTDAPLPPPPPPPHIVLITAGDIALEDISPYGGPIQTPNLERLAALGSVFERAYSAAVQPGPARAALASGRYPQRFGYHFDTQSVRRSVREQTGIPNGVQLISQRLRRYGYRTAHVGSWHLGAAPNFYPTYRGYDSFWGTLGASTAYIAPRAKKTVFAQTPRFPRPPVRLRFDRVYTGQRADVVDNDDAYLTDDMGDYIVRELEAGLAAVPPALALDDSTGQAVASEQPAPMFLWAAFHAPRQPLTALRSDMAGLPALGSQQRQVYGAMIKALDRNIGKILDALERSGALEDTLIIFTADRGCDGLAGTCPCGTLRGGSPNFHEGGLRVPLIIAMPGRFASGQRIDAAVISMDVTATMNALGDPQQRYPVKLDGIDLSPLLADNSIETAGQLKRRRLFWQQHPFSAVLSADIKYVANAIEELPELYDLSADPGERRNIARRQKVQSADLAASLSAWQQGNMPPVWQGYSQARAPICGRQESILAPTPMQR